MICNLGGGWVDILDGLSGARLCRILARHLEPCSRPGPVDEACSYAAARAKRWADRATLVRALRECGAWDDLEGAPESTLRERVLFAFGSDG